MHAMMSSSPTNGLAKNKTKLSVASLLSTATADRVTANEKLPKPAIITINSENIYKDVATSAPPNARSLPTVANSELLYKSISSTRSLSPTDMPPLAPTRPQMVVTRPPIGIIRPVTPTVNYSMQEVYDERGFIGYTSVTSPLSHIKTLTNNVTIPIENSQYPVKTMYSNVAVSSMSLKHELSGTLSSSNMLYTTLSNLPVSISSALTDSIPTISGDNSFTNICLTNKCEVPASSLGGMNIENQAVMNSKNDVSPTTCPKSVSFSAVSRGMRGNMSDMSSGKINSSHLAVVPKGWNRISEKGIIIYISPNKSRIKSYDDMIDYLESEDTCKCGLECPVKPQELFNFNPKVPSKLSISNSDAGGEKDIFCDTCKEFEDLLVESMKQKRRGRRRGRTKSNPEDEDKPSCDRKKILLTGASPLEMFQSGMEAINALSGSQFKIFNKVSEPHTSLVNKFNSRTSASKASRSRSNSSDTLIQMLSNSLPGGAHSVSVANNGAVQSATQSQESCIAESRTTNLVSLPSSVPSFASSNVTFHSTSTPTQVIPKSSLQTMLTAAQSSVSVTQAFLNSPQAVATIYQSAKSSNQSAATTYQQATASTNLGVSSVNLNHVATNIVKSESVDMPFPSSLMGNKKRVRKTKPKSSGIDSFGDFQFPAKKKTVKKVLPDVDIKKASELQLHEYLHHPTYLLNQSSGQQSNDVPILKGIHTDTPFSSKPQMVTSQLLSKEEKSTVELQDIYNSLHVGVMTQQPSSPAFSKTEVSSLSTAYHKTDLASSQKEPPPNRTASSTNQLPEALVNQLGYKYSSSPNFSSDHNVNVKSVAVCTPKSGSTTVSDRTVGQSVANPPLVTTITERVGQNTISPAYTTTAKAEINNQPLNRPLQNVSMSQNILTTIGQAPTPNGQQMRPVQNVSMSQNMLTPPSQSTSANGQHMVLLQFVTQTNTPGKSTLTKVSNPIVRAYSVSHPQAYVHTQGQSKFVLMGKNNASQTLATLAMQNKSNCLNTPPVDATKQTLQIQSLIPVQTNASQISPGVAVSHAVPVQYVTTVNHPGLPLGNQNVEHTYPVMQYIPPTRPAHVSYVYPATCASVIRPTISSIANNYVRIAPAMQPITTTVNFYEIEKQKKEQELLESLQEQLMLKSRETTSITSNIPPVTLCTASAFLTTVTLSTTKISHSISSSASDVNMAPSLPSDINKQAIIDVTNTRTLIKSNENSSENSKTTNYSNCATNVSLTAANSSCSVQTVYTATTGIDHSFTAQLVPALSTSVQTYTQVTSACIPSAVICSPHALPSGNVVLLTNSYPSHNVGSISRCSTSNSSTPTADFPSNGNDLVGKVEQSEEITLQCNEKSTDLLMSSEESKRCSPENDSISSINSSLNSCRDNISPLKSSINDDTFSVGELVWVKIAGYPSWPGRVVSYVEAKKPKLSDGRVYVSWFGSNQVNAVDFKQLKSFDEGFKGLDGSLTKRGYRANKKQLNELEKAIAAALEHSERNQGKFDVGLNSDVNNL